MSEKDELKRIFESLEIIQKEQAEFAARSDRYLLAVAKWLKVFDGRTQAILERLDAMAGTIDQLNAAITQTQTDLAAYQAQVTAVLAGAAPPDLTPQINAVQALDTAVNNARAALPPAPVTPAGSKIPAGTATVTGGGGADTVGGGNASNPPTT